MNILIGIILFIIGFTLGIFTRNILMRIMEINNKIEQAKKIIAEEKKKEQFREKYDFSDCFDKEEE